MRHRLSCPRSMPVVADGSHQGSERSPLAPRVRAKPAALADRGLASLLPDPQAKLEQALRLLATLLPAIEGSFTKPAIQAAYFEARALVGKR